MLKKGGHAHMFVVYVQFHYTNLLVSRYWETFADTSRRDMWPLTLRVVNVGCLGC